MLLALTTAVVIAASLYLGYVCGQEVYRIVRLRRRQTTEKVQAVETV